MYDEHPRHFYMGVPPPGGGIGSWTGHANCARGYVITKPFQIELLIVQEVLRLICRKLRSYPRKTEARLERAAKIEPREVLGFALLKHNVNTSVFSKRELISNPGLFSVP